MRTIKLLFISALLLTSQAEARDDLLLFSFTEAVDYGRAENVLNPNISFHLADTNHPEVQENLGEWKSNKKTNAFGKSDLKACRWALLSALKSLQERAISLGANGIINIKSNYKNQEFISSEAYQCGSGAIMAGVALKADVVKFK